MNIIKIKNCSSCGTAFNCGDTPAGDKCWCNDFPPIFAPSDVIDCLCPNCFKSACSVKIDEYVQTVSPETAAENKAKDLPKTEKLIEGIDFYLENGNVIYKEFFHLKRGHCCKEDGCQHCPY